MIVSEDSRSVLLFWLWVLVVLAFFAGFNTSLFSQLGTNAF